jgi:hypothetical protein
MFSGPGVYKATNQEDKTHYVKNVVLLKGNDVAWLEKPSANLPQEVYCSSCHLTDCSASLAGNPLLAVRIHRSDVVYPSLKICTFVP